MPMIDVFAAAGTFGNQHALAQNLATELMTIEGGPDIPMFRKNTAAFVHELPPSSLSNVDGDATYVRVQVLTNAGALDRDKQLAVVERLSAIVAQAAADPSLVDRTWVLLTEAPDGGWVWPGTPTRTRSSSLRLGLRSLSSKRRSRASRAIRPLGLSRQSAAGCTHRPGDRLIEDADQVDAGERTVNLLHPAARGKVAEVDRGVARVLEEGDHPGLCIGVIPRQEDHAFASGLVRIRAKHRGGERVRGLDDAGAGDAAPMPPPRG